MRLSIQNDQFSNLTHETCALYRYNSKQTVKDSYELIYTDNFDICQEFSLSDNQTLNLAALFVKYTKNTNCTYNEFFSLIQNDGAALAIIGSDGPFVIFEKLFK